MMLRPGGGGDRAASPPGVAGAGLHGNGNSHDRSCRTAVKANLRPLGSVKSWARNTSRARTAKTHARTEPARTACRYSANHRERRWRGAGLGGGAGAGPYPRGGPPGFRSATPSPAAPTGPTGPWTPCRTPTKPGTHTIVTARARARAALPGCDVAGATYVVDGGHEQQHDGADVHGDDSSQNQHRWGHWRRGKHTHLSFISAHIATQLGVKKRSNARARAPPPRKLWSLPPASLHTSRQPLAHAFLNLRELLPQIQTRTRALLWSFACHTP